MATPCNGILECRDGSDENCDEDKWILVIILSFLFLVTICIYLHLICIMLPKWKKTIFQDFDGKSSTQDEEFLSCNEMMGNDLASLKVYFHLVHD